MKYRLMDLLACPICKSFPLELRVFETRGIEVELKPDRCELYCGFSSKWIKELAEEPRCEECWKIEVVSGILICKKCGRWYPIQDEIPRMLPDDLRDRNEDVRFLARWKARIPAEILEKGKPFNLVE
ncbi:MAG: Trm112 family protein [Thaumarchaeota archaeon]|nr:MAG: Trm112 family protein [Nitrososphaerota archaeon]RLG05295.1 MAG: Trm112 family protein [Nitrososphaerota archaeon]HDD42632.1 Trm112 family protein [Nitrososphaeria archaeon]